MWRNPGEIGRVYRVTPWDLKNRWLSNSHPPVQIREGDLVMPVDHSGDCFYGYRFVELTDSTVRFVGPRFGAYALGEPTDMVYHGREWHLLMAGETIAPRSVMGRATVDD